MALVWASQFLSIMGFSFALPISAYFLQVDLGVADYADLKFWVALFSASAAGTMAVAAPVWLAKRVPESRQGMAFGLASTTRSIGWAISPLAAGAVAAVNLRAVFGVAAIGYVGLAVLFTLALRARRGNGTRPA